MDVLQVHFLNSNTVRRSRQAFTIYEIEVRSSHSIPWVLYKRYTQFWNLNVKLQKAAQTDPKLSRVTLPELPPKSLKAMHQDYVEWRLKKLQEFLQKLIQIPEIVRTKAVCEFLNVPEEVRALLQRRTKPHNQQSGSHISHAPSPNKSLLPQEQEIMDLLTNLSLEQHKVKALGKFENFFFDKKPRYTSEWINILFVGDEAHQGLIQACGTFSHSKVARCAALNLLAKLLDIERNKEAVAFLDRFAKLDHRVFKEINLQRHILEPQTQLSAFQIARILKERIPSMPTQQYIPEIWASQEFDRWLDLQMSSVAKTMFQEPELETQNVIEFQEGVVYSEILNTKMEEIEFVFENACDDWRWVEDEFKSDKSVEAESLKIAYVKDANNDNWKMKCLLDVSASAENVYKYLNERGLSFLSKKMTKVEKITDLDNYSSILRMVFKHYSSPYKHYDLCTLVGGVSKPDGTYRVGTLSIDHHNAPESKDMSRVILLPSGWHIKPLGPEKCHVQFFAQMTNESVLIVSPDLLGETDDLMQSLIGLANDVKGVSNDVKK